MQLIFHRGKISMGWGLSAAGEVVIASEPRELADPALEHTCASGIPEAWLAKFNEQAAADEMPYHQRPYHALLAWTEERNCSVVFGSKLFHEVDGWFRRHSPPEAHHIGPCSAVPISSTGTFGRLSFRSSTAR